MKTYFECDFVDKVPEQEFPIVYFRVVWALSLPIFIILILLLFKIILIKWKKTKSSPDYLVTLLFFIIFDF